jgi:hypothetical protein
VLVCVLALALAAPTWLCAETIHKVYLKGTDSQLDVYFIKGRLPGPTLLILGGIQGNEPGGYLAADLYADLSLKTGNLVVVPRANFSSILKDDRGLRGDMNRKFSGNSPPADQDGRVVTIIKDLMRQSDFFVNLHDGSGFFSDEWESPLRNPMRYGQSVIADADVHSRNDGKILKLGDIAHRVIERVNSQIGNPDHVFKFNNHRTLDPTSRHKEQRRSATFHAMTQLGIPAFGIETSKEIPDYRLRVHYQTIVINAFMQEFGIEPEHPKIYLESPYLKYLIISIDGQTPIVVGNGDTLKVQPGDAVRIVHIESNYSRGLTARFADSGPRLDDVNRDVRVRNNTTLEVRKDRFLIGKIPVEIVQRWSGRTSRGLRFEPRVDYFIVRVNERNHIVEPGEELTVARGDTLEILDPVTNLDKEMKSGLRMDLRGFQSESNPREDRGHSINTDKDLQEKYGAPREEVISFPLQAKLNGRVFGECGIAVRQPKLEYVVLRGNNGVSFVAYPGDKLQIPPNEVIRIMDLRTNVAEPGALFVTLAGRSLRWRESGSAGITAAKLPGHEIPLDITRKGRSLGRIWVKPGDDFRLTSSQTGLESRLLPVRY